MSSSINAQINGTFTADAVPSRVFVALPSGYTELHIFNQTGIAAGGAGINFIEGKSTLPAHSCITGTGSAPIVRAVNLSAGLTFIADSGSQTLSAPVAITAITNATPAVISSASPAGIGDIVRIWGTTGMFQVGGWDFSVSATNPGVTQTIANLPAGAGQLNFLAAATAGFIQVVSYDPRFYPPNRRITYITQAAQAVITMSVNHGYTVGQLVRLSVPPAYGMVEMDGLLVTVVATTLGTITVNVNSTAFTAFVFPPSATAALGTLVAEVVPVGETAAAPYQNLLDDATRNISFTGVLIDPAVLVSSNVYTWVAYKGATI